MSYNIQISSTGDATEILLSGDCTIYFISKLKEELVDLLSCSNHLQIHLGGVNDFDSSALQLFFLLKREAIRQQKKVSFVSHSRSVLEVLDLLGSIGALEDKVVLSKESKKGYSLSYGLKKCPKFLKLV